jgi:hypothetical protein
VVAGEDGKTYETNVGNNLGATGRDEVDSSAVLSGVVIADEVDGLLLEELVSSELQRALDEVAGDGGAEAGEESTSTLVLDDLAEAADHAPVVGGRVELDARLDAVDGVLDAITLWRVGGTPGHRTRFVVMSEGAGEKSGKGTGSRSGEDSHVNGSKSAMGDAAANGTGKGELGASEDCQRRPLRGRSKGEATQQSQGRKRTRGQCLAQGRRLWERRRPL